MATIPRTGHLDDTLSLIKEGYEFLQRKREESHSDIVALKMMGMTVICLRGEEGARLFYDVNKFKRSGAVPLRVQKTLTGKGAIQTLDDGQHQQRKVLFLSIINEQSIPTLMAAMGTEWEKAIVSWEEKGNINLFHQMQQLTCKAVCAWTGVPLLPGETEDRAQDFAAMVDGFGAFGPRHWRGKRARKRAEEWIAGVIEHLRSGIVPNNNHTPAYTIAHYREDGALLDSTAAAIELINLLRPTVAISWYIVFSALALHQYPECRNMLLQGDDNYAEWFVQEVRRFYPLAPFTGAIVREDFDWKRYHFEKGTMTFLDLYGINHDKQLWQHPEQFIPERFANWSGSPFNFVPHGGGDPRTGHRCPGERITIEATKIAVDYLANRLQYDVPPQDLHYSLQRMPTYPKSGFDMTHIKAKTAVGKAAGV